MTHPIDELFRKQAKCVQSMPPKQAWQRLVQRLDRHQRHKSTIWLRWSMAATLLALIIALSYFATSIRPRDFTLASAQEGWEELSMPPPSPYTSVVNRWQIYQHALPSGASATHMRRLLLRSESMHGKLQLTEAGMVRAAVQLIGLWQGSQHQLLLQQQQNHITAWRIDSTSATPLFKLEGNQFILLSTQARMATRLQCKVRADGFTFLKSTWMGEITLAFHPQANEWHLTCRQGTTWYDMLEPLLGPADRHHDNPTWIFHRTGY